MVFYLLAVKPWVNSSMDKMVHIHIEVAGNNQLSENLRSISSVTDLMNRKAMPIRNISYQYKTVQQPKKYAAITNVPLQPNETLAQSLKHMRPDENFKQSMERRKLLRLKANKGDTATAEGATGSSVKASSTTEEPTATITVSRSSGKKLLHVPGMIRKHTSTAGKPAPTATSSTTEDTEKKPAAKKTRKSCLLYTSPSPRDQRGSRMPSSA